MDLNALPGRHLPNMARISFTAALYPARYRWLTMMQVTGCTKGSAVEREKANKSR